MATNRSLPPVSAPVARPATSPRGGNQFQTVKDMFTSTLGAGIGRQARSRNIAVAARRSVSPPPAKAPVVSTIRQPLKDGNVVRNTARNSVSKQDTARQPRGASRPTSIPGTRPAVSRSAGLVDAKRPYSMPQSTRRDVTTTGNVVPKPSVKESGYAVTR